MIIAECWLLIVVLLALAIDAMFGEPLWLWKKLPHPVVVIGKLIAFLEAIFNRPTRQSVTSGRLAGGIVVGVLVFVGGAVGWLLQTYLFKIGVLGGFLCAVIGSTLIAQRSLSEHVKRVEDALDSGDIEQARQGVSMIVGRDPAKLDEAGIARAAIESLAENFSDGIVAPVFWFCLFGLPGLVIYKIINTADSMIGHRNERYENFGYAAARIDDFVNYVPARLTMLLLMLSPSGIVAKASTSLHVVWAGIMKDAPLHRSPNAGWPEAVIAYRLGIALSGPRYYDGVLVDEAYVNDVGKHAISAPEIAQCLGLYHRACMVQFGVIALIAFLAFHAL